MAYARKHGNRRMRDKFCPAEFQAATLKRNGKMLALIVTACLNASPSQCEEHVVEWTKSGNAEVCQSEGAPAAAGWAKRNPEFTVKAARCIDARGGGVLPVASSE